jgi:hypothetical protein
MTVQNIQPVNPTPLSEAMTVANPNQRSVEDAEAFAFANQVGSNSVSSVNSGTPDFSNATMNDVNKVVSDGIVINIINEGGRMCQELKEIMEEQN